MSYATTTLTGTYHKIDGSPAKGRVEITPSVPVVKSTADDVILSGKLIIYLDDQGSFSVVLPATDDTNLNPTGFGNTLVAKLTHDYPDPISFALPTGSPVDIEDVTPVNPASFEPTATYVEQSDLDALEQRVGALEDSPAVADHGDLTGLAGDDHPQYALADGSRGDFASTGHSHDAAELGAETPAGAQVKADLAYTAANTYTDSQIAAEAERADGAYAAASVQDTVETGRLSETALTNAFARSTVVFPPPPIAANPAPVSAVNVSGNSETLPHPSTAGTSVRFSNLAEPGRYDYFGNAGQPFTHTWNGNPVIRAGVTMNDIGYSQFATRIVTDSSWVMLRSQLSPTGNFDGRIQIRVNGQPLWSKPKVFSGAYAGAFGGIDVTFRDNSWKTVEIFSTGWVYSLNYEAGRTLNPWVQSDQKKLHILGDSWVTDNSQTDPVGSFPRRLQSLAPWDVSYNGQSGTGYVNNSTGQNWKCRYGDPRRLQAVYDYQPDVLMVFGSTNDNGLSGIQATAAALYADVATNSPDTKIVAVGPPLGDSQNPATSAALQAACDAAPNVIGYADPIAEGWDLSGVRGPSDYAHPSILGAEWYAHRVMDTVRRFTVADGDNSW